MLSPCRELRDEQPQGQDSDLVEALRELERLELALVEEKARSFQLCEEKRAAEESYARDLAQLESMLQQALTENEGLQARLSVAEGGDTLRAPAADKEGAPPKAPELAPPAHGPVQEVDEPEMERGPANDDSDGRFSG